MKKALSILLACLLVSTLGAIHVFAAPTGRSARTCSTAKLQSQLSDGLAKATDSARYSLANIILGDSDYLIVQSPTVSVKVAKKAHPELNWTFDEMEYENGRYVNEIQAVDSNGVTQKVKVDALTSEIVSDTLADTQAANPQSGTVAASTPAAQTV